MRVGLCLPQLGGGLTVEIVREFAVRAEQFGYGSLWVQDHFMWPLSPTTMITDLARRCFVTTHLASCG